MFMNHLLFRQIFDASRDVFFVVTFNSLFCCSQAQMKMVEHNTVLCTVLKGNYDLTLFLCTNSFN